MTTFAITTLLVTVTIITEGSTAIKNYCNVVVGDHYFSINKNSSQVYTSIDLYGQGTAVQGYCDTVTDGGGWLVIQRRKDGSEDFNRFWWEYEIGFGDLRGEFWYGLHAIHCLTNQGQWELRIDYIFPNGTNGYLSYSNFRVGPATEQYPLTISGYQGINGDTLAYNNGSKFTAKDNDNNKHGKGRNCAVSYVDGNAGGWWYRYCSFMYPNHRYQNRYGIYLNGKCISLSFVEIKIRPINCNIY